MNLISLVGPIILLTTMIGIAVRSSSALLHRISQERIWHRSRNAGLNDLIIDAARDLKGLGGGLYCIVGQNKMALSLCLVPNRLGEVGSEDLFAVFDQVAGASNCPITEIPSDGLSRLSPRGLKLTRGSNIAARTCEGTPFNGVIRANLSAAVIAVGQTALGEKVLVTSGFLETELLVTEGKVTVISGGDLHIRSIVGDNRALITLVSATGRVEVNSIIGSPEVRVISYERPVINSDVLASGVVKVEDLMEHSKLLPMPAGMVLRDQGGSR